MTGVAGPHPPRQTAGSTAVGSAPQHRAVPYSRIRAGGASEGDGVRNRVDENEEASRQLATKAEADGGRKVAGVTGGY
eukprot:SAG11_NODE_719_length_7564_cov_14.939317_4_plen_78_part_00